MIMRIIPPTLLFHPQRYLQLLAPPANTCPTVLLALVVSVAVERLPVVVGLRITTVAIETLDDVIAEVVTTAEATADTVNGDSLVESDFSVLMMVSVEVMAVGLSCKASLVTVRAEPDKRAVVALVSAVRA